jgi:membrane AbrB-like protein
MNQAVLLVLVLAPVGAALAARMGVPGGAFFGALVLTATPTLLLGGGPYPLPPILDGAVQILVGLLIGLRASRGFFGRGPRILVAAAALAASALALALTLATGVQTISSLDPTTAFFAAVPGGMAEISLVAHATGSDGAMVAAVHMLRVVLVIAVANALVNKLLSAGKGGSCRAATGVTAPPSCGGSRRRGTGASFAAIGSGTLCGLVAASASIPAGAVVGAAAGAAAVNLRWSSPPPPRRLTRATQALCGGTIGVGLSSDSIGQLASIVPAALVIAASQMALWYSAAVLLRRYAEVDRLTALVASAPGGMGELVAISERRGVDTTVVAVAHLTRLAAIIALAPLIALIPAERI